MSRTIISLDGSKQLLASLFEMEIHKITETIRRESSDDKDKLILEHEAEIERLKKELSVFKNALGDIRNMVCKEGFKK